jgi:hypothetical protein
MKRARAARVMATAAQVVGKEEVNGKGGKSHGDGNKGGRQATKRAMARLGGAILTAMRMAGDEEGNSKEGKSDGNNIKGGR